MVVHHPEHILVDDGLQLLQHLAFHGHLALQVVAHQTVAEGVDAPHALAIKLEDVAVFGILVDAIDIVDGIGILGGGVEEVAAEAQIALVVAQLAEDGGQDVCLLYTSDAADE